MPVAVNQPRAREKEADPLDTIIKGLSIATSIYGIKDGMDKAKLLEADRASKATQQTQDNEFKQRELDIREKDASRKQTGDPLVTAIKQQQLMDAQRKSEESQKQSAFEKTTEGRVSKLTGEKAKRLDEARMGFTAVNGMAAALDNGDDTFSMVGDNDFTRFSSAFEEGLGRMQSGGMIGKEEAARFRKMRPTAMDSKEQQRAKLLFLQDEFTNRMKTLGFAPQDFGTSKADFQYGLSDKIKSMSDPSMPTANAKAKPATIQQNGHTYYLNPKTGKYE